MRVYFIDNQPFFNHFSLHFQYHRGRPTNGEVWVFRMVDTYHQPALDFWKWVQRRNAAILPNIQAHVAAGTVVHSDQ